MKFLVKKHFGNLIPVYNSDLEALKSAKLKENDIYEVDIKRKRNYEFHKKYFALINLCFDNQETFTEFEDLRNYLTMKAGYVKKIETGTGQMILPLSISFAKMDNIEFEQLYQKTIDVICKFIDVDEKGIMSEIINYL